MARIQEIMAYTYISAFTIPDWRHGDGDFTVRVVSDQNWFSNTNEQVSGASGNYFTGTATASNGTCTVAAITIRSTESVTDNDGRYLSAKIYDGKKEKHTILENFTVPESLGETTSWSEIERTNTANVFYRQFFEYLDYAQMVRTFVTKSELQTILEYVLIDDDGIDAGEILLEDGDGGTNDFLVLI